MGVSERKFTTVTLAQEFERPPESPLTLQHAALLFFHSYDHAQGSPPLQRQIFNFVHLMKPNWKIYDNFRDNELRPLALEKISRFLNSGKNHLPVPSTKSIEQDLDDRLNDFQNALNPQNNDTSRQIDHAVLSISKGIVYMDFENLVVRDGRPYNKDHWKSYLCHHGLLGNTTNIPEFDIMYKMVNNFIRTPGHLSHMTETDAKLDAVISKFLEKHPNIPSVW